MTMWCWWILWRIAIFSNWFISFSTMFETWNVWIMKGKNVKGLQIANCPLTRVRTVARACTAMCICGQNWHIRECNPAPDSKAIRSCAFQDWTIFMNNHIHEYTIHEYFSKKTETETKNKINIHECIQSGCMNIKSCWALAPKLGEFFTLVLHAPTIYNFTLSLSLSFSLSLYSILQYNT